MSLFLLSFVGASILLLFKLVLGPPFLAIFLHEAHLSNLSFLGFFSVEFRLAPLLVLSNLFDVERLAGSCSVNVTCSSLEFVVSRVYWWTFVRFSIEGGLTIEVRTQHVDILGEVVHYLVLNSLGNLNIFNTLSHSNLFIFF